MITTVIADTTQGLKEALDEIFAPFGGVVSITAPEMVKYFLTPGHPVASDTLGRNGKRRHAQK